MRAAWSLALLATICAELTFTAIAVPETWLLLPLLLVMYGAGVVVVREVVVRAGGGWPSLVALAIAYQIAEDGLGLQALTSPNMYGAAQWGLRAGGINWTYWQSQLGVHIVLSVLVPTAITNLLFPHLRTTPYLHRRGMIVTSALAIIGIAGLRTVISATEDPGYQTPWPWTAVFIGLIAAAAWLGLRILPRRQRMQSPIGHSAPHPITIAVVSGTLTLVFLSVLLPLGLGPATLLGDTLALPLRLATGAGIAALFIWLALRWRGTDDWNDNKRLTLIAGILIAHTAFMMPTSPKTATIGLIAICLQVAGLIFLCRHGKRPS
ncbi:hypothetical protein ASU32_19190 [Tsukamurella tyrosinosolvens]|nr:hypothetical protein ASU32_19190 [Tsukamurella tyrosinosolvens]